MRLSKVTPPTQPAKSKSRSFTASWDHYPPTQRLKAETTSFQSMLSFSKTDAINETYRAHPSCQIEIAELTILPAQAPRCRFGRNCRPRYDAISESCGRIEIAGFSLPSEDSRIVRFCMICTVLCAELNLNGI